MESKPTSREASLLDGKQSCFMKSRPIRWKVGWLSMAPIVGLHIYKTAKSKE